MVCPKTNRPGSSIIEELGRIKKNNRHYKASFTAEFKKAKNTKP